MSRASNLRAMIKEMSEADDADKQISILHAMRQEMDGGGDILDEQEEVVDEGLNDLADLVESAGFEVPEDIDDVESFLAAVERDVLEDEELDERLGAKIKEAWGKAREAVGKYIEARKAKIEAKKKWREMPYKGKRTAMGMPKKRKRKLA
jgi:hypothetical protein